MDIDIDIGKEALRIEEGDFWLSHIPFIGALGLSIAKLERGKGTVRVQDGLARSPAAIAGILDQIASLAIRSIAGPERPQATLNMDISFLQMPNGTPLLLTGELIAIRQNMAHVRLSASQQADNMPIIYGSANFILGVFPGGGVDRLISSDEAPHTTKPCPITKPFHQWLGMQFADGMAHLPIASHLIGGKHPPVLHGGASFAASIEAALNIFSAAKHMALRQASIHYMNAGVEADSAIHLTTHRIGRSTANCAAALTQNNGERIVTTSQFRFMA